MSKTLPPELRTEIQTKLWLKADQLGWLSLRDVDKASWYANWSKDKDVGGVLAHFMDPRKVRVYIKDSLLKPYHRSRLQDSLGIVLSSLGLTDNVSFRRNYLKPHGRMTLDGRVLCWGNSRDWKNIILAAYERAYQHADSIPLAAVMIDTGNLTEVGTREMAATIGARLGLKHVLWVDGEQISVSPSNDC